MLNLKNLAAGALAATLTACNVSPKQPSTIIKDDQGCTVIRKNGSPENPVPAGKICPEFPIPENNK